MSPLRQFSVISEIRVIDRQSGSKPQLLTDWFTTRVSSLRGIGIVFRPEWGLNCTGSLMSEVGHDPGPIHDATLSPRQALLRFLELAFGVTHALTLGSVELWVCVHAGCQT
jgi:hypothetical protein